MPKYLVSYSRWDDESEISDVKIIYWNIDYNHMQCVNMNNVDDFKLMDGHIHLRSIQLIDHSSIIRMNRLSGGML